MSTTSTVSGNDPFLPQPFKGHSNDDHENFIIQFEQFVAFKRLDQAAQLQLIPLLLTDHAREWYIGLQDDKKDTIEHLKAAFKNRFQPSNLLKWQRVSHLWERGQLSTESVDEYVTEMRKIARTAQIPDDMLLNAIIKNFRPEIRRFVVQSRAADMDAVLQAARAAEIVEPPIGSPNNLNEVTTELKRYMETEITKLSSKIDRMSVSQVDSRHQYQRNRSLSPLSSSSPTRRVSFALERQSSPRRTEAGGDGQNYIRNTDGSNDRHYNGRRDGGPRRWQWRPRNVSSHFNGHFYTHQRQPQQYTDRRSYFSGRGRPSVRTNSVQCYNCGRFGHISRECEHAYNPNPVNHQGLGPPTDTNPPNQY
jgi:hypothetical protein